MALEIIFAVIVSLCVFITCIQALPGVPMLFGAVFVYSLIDSFDHVSAWQLCVFGALALATLTIDYSAGLLGAKLGGASKQAILFGFIGFIIGLISFPPLGALLGLFAGVFIAELIRLKNYEHAIKAAASALFTSVLGAVVNVMIAIVCLVWFLILIF